MTASKVGLALPLQLSPLQRTIELLRPWLLFALYVVTAAEGLWILAAPLSVATCLAAFVQMHDAVHRSLGVSRRAHGLILSASGLLLLKSGHGLQVTHLRHHGHCLDADDPEGACAHWPLYRVMFRGPFHLFAMRFYALRVSPHTRGRQLFEVAATAALLAVAIATWVVLGSAMGIVYWGVAAGLSATMPLWAAYLPHRLAPKHPAIRAAGRVAQIWTPVISSFAYHHLHHAFPKVPTALLAVAAKNVGPEQYKWSLREDVNRETAEGRLQS